MGKKFSGIDIIKILAVLFVPSLHFFLNYNFSIQPMISYGKLFQLVIRWISFSCIGLFIMSTGFLQCNKSPTKEYFLKIIRYILIYCCYCVITAVIIHGSANAITNSMYYIFRFPAYFWYMGFFFGFYLLIPFFNMIIAKIQDRVSYEKFLFILTIVISIPPFINSLPPLIGKERLLFLPNWWAEFFPILYYMLGAYFRKYNPKIPKKIAIPLLIISPLLISIIDFRYAQGNPPTFIGGGYGSILTVTISICIFAVFYRINIKSGVVNKILSYFSGITLEIYLGLIISDKYTSEIIKTYFNRMLDPYDFKLYLIEFPLNLLISVAVAVIVKSVFNLASKIFNIFKSLRKIDV